MLICNNNFRLRYITHCPIESMAPSYQKSRQSRFPRQGRTNYRVLGENGEKRVDNSVGVEKHHFLLLSSILFAIMFKSTLPDYGLGSSSEEFDGISGGRKKKQKKKVRYYDLLPGDIHLPEPTPVIKHTPSDKSILKVPSPKTSGEFIGVQRASVQPKELQPPLPAQSGHELVKPHSGIVINADKDFVVDIPVVGGPGHHSDLPYTTIGVTDGKPRARGTQKHLKDDDSVCGLDEIPKPEHVHIPANLKRGTLKTHSLTVLPCTKEKKADIHYGILTGSFNMYDSKFGNRSRGRQALTMSVMAYCLAFHYHPKQWTMKLIDNLIDAGDQWYLQCLEKVHDHSSVQGMCEVLPFGKKQTLNLNGKRMQVLLGEPDVVGYTMSLDPTVYNLCRGLKAFFADNRAGILLTRVLKLVIWKDKICYYIFDPAGRDSRAYSNFTNGSAALINVKDVASVAEVVLARSVVEDQKCFEDTKFRQALPIAVVAMTYAKISPPNTWFTKTLDKILRLGNKLYVECAHPKVVIDITIDNIPNEINLGPFACEIIIYRERIKGQLFTTKDCFLNIKTGLEEFFNREYNSGILEFNNYSLAVWRQKDMYYLFDCYPRTNDGLRSHTVGKACCWMLLNPETMASVFTKNWDYLPVTTPFCIHAFKVLKLKKREPKKQIVCTLSDEQLPGGKFKRREKYLVSSKGHGDGKEVVHEILAAEPVDDDVRKSRVDEEQMGDIISLVDSIQDDYLPPIPLRYKKMEPEPEQPKIVNLDSPTVSVTQVVPPWPAPRDKSRDPPEPDPDPEPTPPPTPPPMPEEAEEEEEDEEAILRKKEERERKKAEEEEARRKAEELPPPLPPPPPSPQPEPEVPLAPIEIVEDEVQTFEPVDVDRRILLTEDARQRSKLRQYRKKLTPPLDEVLVESTPSEELYKPSNFKTLPDNSQIIRGTAAITGEDARNVLPFAAIMAIVTSYKYMISTWTPDIVNFVIDSAKKLYKNKLEKFQLAPVHIIPKISIGHQTYHAHIDVATEGPTWQLENIINKKFFNKYDRGMITTTSYSAAFFKKNGIYYLFDASPCTPMGIRDDKAKGSNACFLRFKSLHDLVIRMLYNKDGTGDDQQFVLSRILVRKLLREPRMKLPEDYDYSTGAPASSKSKQTLVDSDKRKDKKTSVDYTEPKSETVIGYQQIQGLYRIEGTTCLNDRSPSSEVKASHFVSLIAMLMAAMHPIRTWDHFMVDTCIEKGLEIFEKATNLKVCEKRVIKNIILEGKLIDVNIKKILVINENPQKTLEQYLNAVLRRLRFVIIRFPGCSIVLCRMDGYYHLFDPNPPPANEEPEVTAESKEPKTPVKSERAVATWTLYRSIDAVIRRIRATVAKADHPEFYTFELTSVKSAPKHSALNYRLSPLFKPDQNPNLPYLRRRKPRPLIDEKMYWLNIEMIPWSRMNPFNDAGIKRGIPKSMWKDWDIEFPGDLYSLWGNIHPLDPRFEEEHRGKQYLATCCVAAFMTEVCNLSAWTSSLLDGIVSGGDKYHAKTYEKVGGDVNHEITVEDLDTTFNGLYPFTFSVTFTKVIFGFVYNTYPDRFNLSKALEYFFESNRLGILVSPTKNLSFGRIGPSYFMFDCQSYGAPIFSPGQGASYILKCESLNRLIYCITVTLNIRRHGQQFHLYNLAVKATEAK
ncbi:hypothetical protein RR48_11029 [Papilio machaon]|uniref:Uncharacterized protein n=1 Tax=Papilio machaon TaxID=76193 RepID=A0A194RPG6_PAPMA|nr:hypothetical protein RR48_11029 [Papilio machaon]